MALAGALKVLGERLSDGPALAFLVLMMVLIVGPGLAQAIRLPAMVGLVLAGMAIGPHAARALDAREIALSNWGTFGLLTSPLGLAPRHEIVEPSDPIEWLGKNLRETDLVVLPGLDAARTAFARVPNLTERSLLVAIAAHGGAFQAVEHTGDLIIGRSATESDHAPATPG